MRRLNGLLSLTMFTSLWGCPPAETPPPPPPPVPTLATIDPGSGLTTGGETVALTGANLSVVSSVAFGTAPGNIISKTDGEIIVTTPANSRGTVSVKATASGGVAELPNAFRYEVGVNITAVEPATISANQATSITITGDGFFVADTNPTVRLDSTPLTVSAATNTSITVAVPALNEGSYDLTVTNTDNRSATATDGLRVLAPIVVGSVAPAWGYSDRTTDVIIRGQGFDGATAVVFGTLNATSFTVRDSSTIAATAPASGGPTGPVAVIVRRGIGDEGQLANGFTYYSATDGQLRVLEVRPGFGRSTGGQTVVVWGTGFGSAVHIYFGADEATVASTTSDGLSVTVQTPAHTLAGSLVEEPVNVRAQQDTSNVTLSNGFTYYRMVEITQVNPTTLATAGGDTVTIDGAGFMPTGMQVLFDNVAASNVAIVSQARLTCVSPVHVEGTGLPVKVINRYNDEAVWNTPGVNFVELTRIQSVTPSAISKAGRTFMTLRGTGLAPTAQQMTVTIDGQPVVDLTRVDQNTLTFHAAGPYSDNPASKVLYIRNNDSGGEHQTNVDIIDATDKVQLHGGGPINHNINVTVIREDRNERLAGAVVFAGNKAAVVDPYDKGVTDVNGMTVISGTAVATGPVMLTIGASGYETQTLMNLNAQHVTVLLTPKVPNPLTETFGVISGSVGNWANAAFPPVQAGQEKRYYRVAVVYVSDTNPIPSGANYGPGVESWTVEIRSAEGQVACPLVLPDGQTVATLSDATYSINSRPGTHAVLAIVFYWDSYDGICGNNPLWGSAACTQANNGQCEGWTTDNSGSLWLGAVFGIRDNITVPVGGGNIANMNITLNHATANYSASFNLNPTVAGADYTAYAADAYLSVGQSGTFTFMSPTKGDGMGLNFGAVPALVAGWTYTVHGYVGWPILGTNNQIVDFTLPVTHSFQRGLTSMSPPTLTNWIYFINNINYSKPASSEGRFTFTRTGGAAVNDNGFTAVGVYHIDANQNVTPLWTVLAAGDQQTVELPDLTGESRIDNIPVGNHKYSVLQANVPNFDFNTLEADDRTSLNWSAAVQSVPMDLTR